MDSTESSTVGLPSFLVRTSASTKLDPSKTENSVNVRQAGLTLDRHAETPRSVSDRSLVPSSLAERVCSSVAEGVEEGNPPRLTHGMTDTRRWAVIEQKPKDYYRWMRLESQMAGLNTVSEQSLGLWLLSKPLLSSLSNGRESESAMVQESVTSLVRVMYTYPRPQEQI